MGIARQVVCTNTVITRRHFHDSYNVDVIVHRGETDWDAWIPLKYVNIISISSFTSGTTNSPFNSAVVE